MKREIPRITWLLLLIAGSAVAFVPVPDGGGQPSERTIKIEASSFAYDPGEVRVNPGDRVTLELTSMDVVHGLYIDDYDLSLIADPGQTARLTFTADKAGSFRLRCNVTCGSMHPFMIGKLYVGDNTNLYRGAGLALLAVIGALVTMKTSKKISLKNAA